MGCGASRACALDESEERYVHLKNLEKSVALSGKVASKGRPRRNVVPAISGDDVTEIEDTQSSYLTRDEADVVSTTQLLLRFLTTKGESETSMDRPLSSLGNLDELSKAMLSVNAGTNQVGALRVQLRTKDPNERDPDGDRVPLHWAAARGHTKCAMVLLRAGADPQLIERASGLTCSELADARGYAHLAVCLRGFASPSTLSSSHRNAANGSGASPVSLLEEAPAEEAAEKVNAAVLEKAAAEEHHGETAAPQVAVTQAVALVAAVPEAAALVAAVPEAAAPEEEKTRKVRKAPVSTLEPAASTDMQ